MKKMLVLAAAAALVWPMSAQAEWPERDISVTVPYPAGGSTDLNARTVAHIMAGILKVNMPVINKPGASGSVGTVDVWNRPRDGYNVLFNGMLAFVNYPVLGYHDKTWRDWHIWISTFTPNVVVTRAENKDLNSFADVVAAMKAKPGQVTVGSAGMGTGGHIGMEVLAAGTGVTYKHVPYEGGAKAITAALSGEVDIVTQLSMEEIDHIRAGKFKALGALTADTYTAEGIQPIPSVGSEVADVAYLLPMGEFTAMAVPKDTPDEIVKKLDAAFNEAMKSDELAKFAQEKGILVTPYTGQAAQDHMAKLASIVSWILFDAGVAKNSPEQFDIPRFEKK